MALPDPTSDALETDSNATDPCMPNLIDHKPEVITTSAHKKHDIPPPGADGVVLRTELVGKQIENMPLHAEVTEPYPEAVKKQMKNKVANFLKKASIVTAETDSCSKSPVNVSQLNCLCFSTPARHLGDVNV